MQLNALIAPCDLGLDIVGAITLALAATNKSDRRITEESGTYWGKNPFLLRANVEARLDGRIGLGFLIVGFMLQAASYFQLGWQNTQLDGWLGFLTILATMLVAVLVRWLFRRLYLSKEVARVESLARAAGENL